MCILLKLLHVINLISSQKYFILSHPQETIETMLTCPSSVLHQLFPLFCSVLPVVAASHISIIVVLLLCVTDTPSPSSLSVNANAQSRWLLRSQVLLEGFFLNTVCAKCYSWGNCWFYLLVDERVQSGPAPCENHPEVTFIVV